MFNRWLVRQEYFGKFDLTSIICTTRSINDAALVIDGLLMCHAGRPFRYFAEKCSDDYFDYLDDVIQDDDIAACCHDYTEYVEGINCLDYGKEV